MKKKSQEQLLESLYNVVTDSFQKVETRLERIEVRLDRVELRLEHVEDKLDNVNKFVNSHETRISRLEDSNQIIKNKLGLA